jgi:phosphoesterase RecJ-like protein
VTDTLAFRTSNVRPRTLEITMALMEAGVSLTEVTQRTMDTKPYKTIMLWKQAFASVHMQGEVIIATVTQEALKQATFSEATDGGLVSVLVTVNEAMIAVVFKELADGRVELSMRCKPGYDVASVAFDLGGGGHKQAAGATIDGPLEAAQKRVIPLLQKAVREGRLTIG